MRGEAGRPGAPEVPGVLRLGWMLFMQPLRLNRLLDVQGLGEAPSLLQLGRRLRARDAQVRVLVSRLARVNALGLLTGALVAGALATAGATEWNHVGALVTIAAMFGIGFATIHRAVPGVALGIAISIVGAIVGALQGVEMEVALGLGMGMALSVAVGDVFGGVLGILILLTGNVAFGAAFILSFFRVPSYLAESIWTLASSTCVRVFPSTGPRLARWLPFRHHDLIRFPLPRLRAFLVDLAEIDPALSVLLMEEASGTVAQKRPARRALIELQARSLERAARERLWARAGALDLLFLPKPEDIDDASPLSRFRKAALDLHAARLTTDHLRRRNALERARATLKSYRTTLIGLPRPDELERRLEPTTRLWLDIIDDDLRALAEDERANPQIPTPFEPGPPLRSDDAHLFKGRADLIRLIDHDLADHRRAPLLLTGQRRMGKTSLLHMLPERLGTGTTLVTLNFQALSGNPHRAEPHRWLAESLAAARAHLPPPPPDATWSETLSWLREAEAALAGDRVLIAIDEIERLQTGIDEGWTSPAFLDFLRAAGDSLRSIRLLLVSANPLHRLGRAWTDRLISVVHREITYLLPDEAEDLIRNPMPGFPDIYPPGGVHRILSETHCHPYLIQLVCDALVRDLNGRARLAADDADITRALDRALDATPLFRELWQDRTDDERALLHRLADSDGLPLDRSSPLRALLQEGHIEEPDEARYVIAVPLFRAWIRDRS